jgi:LacI family transcriptional regulator
MSLLPEPVGSTAKPTAKEVAARAGVSVTTVSRVLSGRHDSISLQTRERVLQIARDLQYRPNSIAAALRNGYTRTIGLMVPDIADAYFHQIARGLEDAAQEAGYSVVLYNTDRIAEKERAGLETFYDHGVDAIVFAGGGVDDETHLQGFPWEHMNVVTIGPHKLPFPSIGVDDVAAVELAVEHLVDQDCERILCLAGQPNWLINAERLKGFRNAQKRHALDPDPALMCAVSFTVQSGYDATKQAIASGLAFDGVIAFNDYTAVGAIKALVELGVDVPSQVAVVGCDDIPIAELVSPGLTSVSFPQYEFGRVAMERALDLIAGRPVAPVTRFEHQLEVRASSLRHPVRREDRP